MAALDKQVHAKAGSDGRGISLSHLHLTQSAQSTLIIVAGAFMIVFAGVEILVVGFIPLQTPDQFPAWLQVLYLVVGGALVFLGTRLWKAESSS